MGTMECVKRNLEDILSYLGCIEKRDALREAWDVALAILNIYNMTK